MTLKYFLFIVIVSLFLGSFQAFFGEQINMVLKKLFKRKDKREKHGK